MRPMVFDLTEEHIKLLKNSIVEWNDCESGAPTISPKCPYGNGDVTKDIAKILGVVEDFECKRFWKLHKETETALQIVLCCGTFRPGAYVQKSEYGHEWELKK